MIDLSSIAVNIDVTIVVSIYIIITYRKLIKIEKRLKTLEKQNGVETTETGLKPKNVLRRMLVPK